MKKLVLLAKTALKSNLIAFRVGAYREPDIIAFARECSALRLRGSGNRESSSRKKRLSFESRNTSFLAAFFYLTNMGMN